MTNRVFVLLLILLLAGSGVAFAQSQSDAEQFYSSGVQAFNSQRYAEAIGFFNKIEGLGTQDPRAFFFRGLSWGRLGHAATATADFEVAAKMELTVAGRSYSVPKALERIQGRERTVIELYRRAAKRAWEAEQNLRKQDEFLSQKAEDMKFYQSMIESGKSEPFSPQAIAKLSDLPFGAQPVTPFVANQQTFRTRTAPHVSQGGLSEDNQFYDDVNRVTPVEQPEDTKPKPQPKPQDPSERGIFDFEDDDEEIGFDVSFQQPKASPVPRSPFGGIGISSFGNDDDFSDSTVTPGGFDDDDISMPGVGMVNPAIGAAGLSSAMNPLDSVSKELMSKENGASVGKGFANLFKKSGSGGASSSQPAVQPQPAVSPSNQEHPSVDFEDDDADPFADTF